MMRTPPRRPAAATALALALLAASARAAADEGVLPELAIRDKFDHEFAATEETPAKLTARQTDAATARLRAEKLLRLSPAQVADRARGALPDEDLDRLPDAPSADEEDDASAAAPSAAATQGARRLWRLLLAGAAALLLGILLRRQRRAQTA